MPLFDSFLSLFRKKPEDTPTQMPSDIRVFPMAESGTNAIALSPDMTTLYLIENGRASSFSLNKKNGIVISTLNGQLTVAAALPDILVSPIEDDSDTPDLPEEDNGADGGPIHRLIPRPRILRLSTKTAQWTLMFIKEKSVLSIIGASDIDTSIIGASDIDTSIIGASDIDTSLSRGIPTAELDIDTGIIGASDIDTSLSRGIPNEPEPEPETQAQTPSQPKCHIYSFRLTTRSINIKKAGELILIQY